MGGGIHVPRRTGKRRFLSANDGHRRYLLRRLPADVPPRLPSARCGGCAHGRAPSSDQLHLQRDRPSATRSGGASAVAGGRGLRGAPLRLRLLSSGLAHYIRRVRLAGGDGSLAAPRPLKALAGAACELPDSTDAADQPRLPLGRVGRLCPDERWHTQRMVSGIPRRVRMVVDWNSLRTAAHRAQPRAHLACHITNRALGGVAETRRCGHSTWGIALLSCGQQGRCGDGDVYRCALLRAESGCLPVIDADAARAASREARKAGRGGRIRKPLLGRRRKRQVCRPVGVGESIPRGTQARAAALDR
mmetsp:Transcript_9302/g.27406  ORF Transcript_9302/g.27406 Transcript_9302/m.27406 type:complete len:304 (+) Transcript_9302:324-1235(+)